MLTSIENYVIILHTNFSDMTHSSLYEVRLLHLLYTWVPLVPFTSLWSFFMNYIS
jgi:hypothetical protein